MAIIIFLIVAVIVPGILWHYINERKTQRLVEKGDIVRRSHNFMQCQHIYKTTTASIQKIGEAVDKGVLDEYQILFEPHYADGQIVFQNKKYRGTFVAVFVADGIDDTYFKYTFQVAEYKESNNSNTTRETDEYGANVLLTALEKAMETLDNQYIGKEGFAIKYKSKWA